MEAPTSNQPYHPSQRNKHSSHVPMASSADHNGMMSQFQGMSLGMGSGHGIPPMAPTYMMGSDNYLLAPMPAPHTMGMNHSADNAYSPGFAVNGGAFSNPYMGLSFPIVPFATPGRGGANHPRLDRGHSDVPGLENRRGSYSTTESTPATPFYASLSQRESGPRVASLDRSTYTTPSPQQLGVNALHGEQAPKAIAITDRALDELIAKDPPIIAAIPAVFTPAGQMKTLEQSLENRIPGNRNVYIRGLHPTTDDELLYQFASRFGHVETSKAIIDTGTGACKGFGFAKFYDVKDSELCIRGFHRQGYEVGFARESFNSRLKAEGDETSTNLYISNLPKQLTEVELGTIFLGYHIVSSKILRDSMGNSRGVGFARFETRDICDDIIRKFNGLSIGEEGLLMNIRYADTPAQKELKRVTTERRQFRTNEYNLGAYGTHLVGITPNLYAQQSQWRKAAPRMAVTLSSSSEETNGTRASTSERGHSQTVTSSSTDAAVVTPTSSECDENVTIRADAAGVTASLDSSPSIKKELAKNEEQ